MPVVYKVLPMCLELSVTYVSGSYREGEDEGENPIHDMPWHVATLYEDRAQYIVPLHFKFFGRSLIYQFYE